MRLIITTLLLLVTTAVFAQTGTIIGTVTTSDDQPAEFVNVGLKGTSKGTITDKKGAFQIKNVEPGSYVITVPVIGLETEEKSVDVKAGSTTTVNISLSESSKRLSEVVVTSDMNRYNNKRTSEGLRLTTPILEIPQNIQTVTGTMLKDQQVISMSDGLIRNVSGLIRAEHWGDMYTNIVARGSQIQAFRNGFNVVNSYWGPLTEDMSFVETIEFVKGPAGFMLSSGDPSGLYNVVTKKPTGTNKGEVSLTVGSFDLYRGSLDLDGKLSKNGRLLYRLNMAAQNKGSFRANEYNDRYTIAPVVSYQLDEKTKLTLEYTYQRANMSNVGSFYIFSPNGYATLPRNFTTLPAGIEGTKINDHSMYANLTHNFNDKWKITGQVARFIYNQVGSSAWPNTVFADGSMIRNIGIWDSKSNMMMGQLFVNGEFETGPVRHRVLGGLDMANKKYLADWSTGFNLDDSTNPFVPGVSDVNTVLGYPNQLFDSLRDSKPLEERAYAGFGFQTQSYTSLYLQDELGFFDNKVRLTLAGRYTDLKQAYASPDDIAKHFTPRVGLSVSIDKETAVYALYDQAFIPQTGRIKGDTVQPITGNNMEIGIKKQWFGGRWNTTLTAYRIVKNNELTADPNEPALSGLSIEMGQKIAEGIEFDLKGTIVRGLSLIANYAYTDSRISKVADGVTIMKVGDVVPGFAKHTANAWLVYRIQSGALKGLGIQAGASYLGDRATYWELGPDANKVLPNYFKLDGGLSWENEKFRVTANVFNILDEYLYSGSYYSWLSAYNWQADPPRNFRLTVGYSF